jgi:hypothetical protein
VPAPDALAADGSPSSPPLPPDALLLAAALAAGATVAEAAAAAGMSERTAHRRLADQPAIREQVGQIRTEAFAATTGALVTGSREVVAALRAVADASRSDAVRVRAYGLLLAEARAHHDLHDLEARVVALEARLPAAPTPTPRRSAWSA